MKARIIAIIMTILVFVSCLQIVIAAESEKNADILATWKSLVVFDGSFEEIEFTPVSRERSFWGRNTNKTITIPVVGMSSFVTFDMEEYNLTADTYDNFVVNEVVYESSNTDVVVAYDGRILARGIGEAVVTIKVGELEDRINVIVENKIPQELVDQVMEILSSNTRSAESDARNAIVEKGAAMVSCVWKPTRSLVKWDDGIPYPANQYQVGLPYSQTAHICDETEFLDAMSHSDFYDTYYDDEGVAMPMYGNDCSSFVAICWGLPYQGLGRYYTGTFYNNYASIGGYENLQRGDAVVCRTDERQHMCLVIQNWVVPPSGSSITTSYVTCYEQTPYNAQLTFLTYNQLSAESFKAISNFGG